MSQTTVFTPEETSLLLEAARIALGDADIFDQIAEDTDTADGILTSLREKLHFALNDSTTDEIQLDTREDGERLLLDGQSSNDYRLTDNATNVWIKVDSVVINIARRNYVEGTQDVIPCIRVEYDLSFFGGNYDKVGKFAFIAVDKINDCTVEEAFEKQTGINRQHIIHFSTDDLYSPQGEYFDSVEVRNKALRQIASTAPSNMLEKHCPHCKADLHAPEAVERHYINKDAPETMGDSSDAIGFGHYDHEGDFEPDRPANLSGGRYDLMDDSDRCASCGGQL